MKKYIARPLIFCLAFLIFGCSDTPLDAVETQETKVAETSDSQEVVLAATEADPTIAPSPTSPESPTPTITETETPTLIPRQTTDPLRDQPKCSVRPSDVQPDEPAEGYVAVLFDVKADNKNDSIVIIKDNERIYECANLQSDPLTGEGDFIWIHVKEEGEQFKFEIGNDVTDNWEAFLVPIPVQYEDSDEIFYYGVVNHYSDNNGWQVGMLTEPPVYF